MRLQENRIYAEIFSWTVVQLIQKPQSIFIRLNDGADRIVAFTLKDLSGGYFELVESWCHGDAFCAENGF